MSENHFRSHFWPFQINMQLFFIIFLQNGCRWPFWMSENNFRSYFWPFQIDTQLYFFGIFLTKWLPSAILDVRNSLWITFLAILDQYRFLIFFKFFFTKWLRWPFWMSENHFRSHFYPFHIDTQLYFFWKFFTKWLTSAILDVWNSLSIAFLAISDRYATFFFWNFWQNGCWRPFWMSEIHFRSHFGCLKITLDRISGHFKLIGHFGCPKFTFDGISGHFRSIRNFNLF